MGLIFKVAYIKIFTVAAVGYPQRLARIKQH
jgi:hypothetical protein